MMVEMQLFVRLMAEMLDKVLIAPFVRMLAGSMLRILVGLALRILVYLVKVVTFLRNCLPPGYGPYL